MPNRNKNIERILRPRSVAFVGGSFARDRLQRCREYGFKGPCWYVNPERQNHSGVTQFANVKELPEAPDAVFVAVRSETTVEVVRELAGIGAGGVVCYAAGFAEMGKEGAALQQQLVEAAGESLAVLGPNCYGFVNSIDMTALWVGPPNLPRIERGIALISQSGALVETMTLGDRSMPIAYAISVGNQAMLGIEEFVDSLIEWDTVNAIGLYIEGLRDVVEFSRVARRALQRGIPIVALKTGQSDVGTRIALGHTGSLTGSDELYGALFRRLGVIRVDSVTTLLETTKLMSITGIPAGRRIAACAASGGDMAITADHASRLGLTFPPLHDDQRETLQSILPDYVSVSNPLDYTMAAWGRADLQRALCTTLAQGDVDLLAMIMEFYDTDAPEWLTCMDATGAVIEASRISGKPAVIISHLPENIPRQARERMIAAGVTPLQGHEDGIRALSHAARYGERRRQCHNHNVNVELVPLTPLNGDATLLSEWEAKQWLAQAGVIVPDGALVQASEAAAAASAIGFPVVVKAAGSAIAHKTEVGAVALDLSSPDAVAASVAQIREAVGQGSDTYLVEAMVQDVVAELLVGVIRDSHFGLALTVGAGGVFTELLEDSRTLLLPCSRSDIERAIQSLKINRLLQGFRGKQSGDLSALVDTVTAIAELAWVKSDQLTELEVNPLLVLPKGKGVVAADALIGLMRG
ncbi:MAG: acetate--CoA ligase family protein [Gammaproteobacteria bacterium]|nr:acetate--CoA ligase family protein [Gammaproteobacteria bacterium]